MDVKEIIKSDQEQVTSGLIEYLKQIRIAKLAEQLSSINENLDEALLAENGNLKKAVDAVTSNLNAALKSIDAAFEDVQIIIDTNRGGDSGIHGYIAEAAQHGVGNAKEWIEGKIPSFEWINDNGMLDLKHGAIGLQMKFVKSGGKLSLNALKTYLGKYPEFLKNKNKFMIPKDFYEKIDSLLEMSDKDVKYLTKNSDPSISEWRFVRKFFEESSIKFEDIEPSDLTYNQVQKNAIEDSLTTVKNTLKKEADNKKNALINDAEKKKDQLKEEAFEEKKIAIDKSKPTIKDTAKAGVIGAALEGGVSFTLAIKEKLKEKDIKDFNSDDWNEIFKKTGIDTAKGGVRGVVVHLMTNRNTLPDGVLAMVDPSSIGKYTTPATVANAVVTASFGMAEQVFLFSKGELSETDFIYNSEVVCLDATISAVSSLIGQTIIPVPVLGALIGNTVGTMMYKIAKDSFNNKQLKVIEKFNEDQKILDKNLSDEYQNFILSLTIKMQTYFDLLDSAFAPDPVLAFKGSIDLAERLGVPTDELLTTKEKRDSYFLD